MELVQPILTLRREGTHVGVITAVALASVRAYRDHPDLPEWDQWLAGSFTKSVRSFKADIDILVTRRDETPHSTCAVGHAFAVAYAPHPADAFPRHIKRAQVAGLDRDKPEPATVLPHDGKGLFVVLDSSVGMSTGKAAAQAAHALFSAHLLRALPHFRGIDTDRARIVWAHPGLMREIVSDRRATVIKDNGRTEVAPGTVTAAAISL